MFYNVVTTYRCNKKCLYCGKSKPKSPLPYDITYSVEDLKKFIDKDNDPVITFYGGEPLLAMDLMKEIMDKIKAKEFMIQTNGTLLDKIDKKYLKLFSTILLSIDGDKEITDFYRGKGTYDVALKNARLIRENGFNGNLVARMTVSEKTDIYKQVMHILNLDDLKFDTIHWQLNMMFCDLKDWKDIKGWIKKSYNPGIDKLIDFWVKEMESSKVHKILPFVGIMKSLLEGEKSKLRCGCGHCFFTIATDGIISACPVTAEYALMPLGDIRTTDPNRLSDAMTVTYPCTKCDKIEICGGRCLFANHFKPWKLDGYMLVCSTIEHLIGELQKKKPEIQDIIDKGKISINDFEYKKYDGCEIIP